YRIEGLDASTSATSRYFYLTLGFDAGLAGTDSSPATTAGDGRFIFTAGRSHLNTGWAWFRFSGEQTPSNGELSGGASPLTGHVTSAATVCLDVTSATPPRVTAWATGQNGADC